MHLFVYGTLLDGLAHGEAERLVQGLPDGQPASVAGELRLAEEDGQGCYPVLVPGMEGRVRGKVVECPDDPDWLAELDAYEGADYRRMTIVAALDDGSEVEAQAYLFLSPDYEDFPLVPNGDFARYVVDTGCKVFGT
jgi:gamma-glutamylcyclotransferase (GGCT)/AIG2-like uncharacterized protein YtfP